MKLHLTRHGQLTPKAMGILTKVFCFLSNFGGSGCNWWQDMAWTNSGWGKFDFGVKFDPKWQSSTPKPTEILTEVFGTSGPNMVILAWRGHKLSRVEF